MRDALIIAAACVVAILLGAGLYFLDQHPEAASAIPGSYRVLASGQQSGSVSERTNYRIRSAEEFNELWAMIYGPGAPIAPAVDFANEEVLAVFDGTHSSGGYDVAVDGVKDEGLTRTISITRTQPGESCVTLAAITSPFELVAVSRSEAQLARDERLVTNDCN